MLEMMGIEYFRHSYFVVEQICDNFLIEERDKTVTRNFILVMVRTHVNLSRDSTFTTVLNNDK